MELMIWGICLLSQESNERADAIQKYDGYFVNCDEYPFSASLEGGYKQYLQGRVSARFIRADDNLNFGRNISKLSRLKYRDAYIVVPILLSLKSGVYGL